MFSVLAAVEVVAVVVVVEETEKDEPNTASVVAAT